jgi:hypothetical protein
MNEKETMKKLPKMVSELNGDLTKNMVKGYFPLPYGKRMNVGIIEDMTVYVKTDSSGYIPLVICANPVTEPVKEKNNYMVKFVIDDGYAQHNEMCIISAEDEKSAHLILLDKVVTSLSNGRYIVDKYTEITKCKDDIVIYDSTAACPWKKKSVYC